MTLIRSRLQQLNSETLNLFRHLGEDTAKTHYLTLTAPYIHADTELMIKVGMVLTMKEKKRLLFSRAEDISTFIDEGRTKTNLSVARDDAGAFIKELRDYLNNIEEE